MRRIDLIPKPYRRLVLLAPGIVLFVLTAFIGILGWHWLLVAIVAAHAGAFCAYARESAVAAGIW